ncbi:hypothetical protein MBORA_16120 [Methanobrevibacter oralis]|uniref:Uncharacterized protein n=1 Tax=Methanobrevibacter oralis TaxID=66851 RepID=A0A166C5A2_METOA|nr:hypothetical protein [Methanobrevibacter oralis]KZX11367.1 hypothetical protein MBORA_16120 [Methanobrevibacter oralis]
MTDELKESLKKLLELELGIPLNPKTVKQYEPDFNDDTLILDYFPINSITQLTIDNKNITDYKLMEEVGLIYFNKNRAGKLYVEYTYSLKEEEYDSLLNLMVEYEKDTSLTKQVSSITEGKRSLTYDTSLSKGALIQSLITDLKNKYSCIVRMI